MTADVSGLAVQPGVVGMSEAGPLRAPMPYFGGKARIAGAIWQRLGSDAKNYVEPFFGSGSVLLARPGGAGKYETVNDLDRMVANLWRAIKHAPEDVARHADWPVNEVDLEARHYWLVTQGRARLEAILGDPDVYDSRIAGWYLWGCASWIGSGWCCGEGAWSWSPEGGWAKRPRPRLTGIDRKRFQNLPKGVNGGVNRQLPLLSSSTNVHAGLDGSRVTRKLPDVQGCKGLNVGIPDAPPPTDEEARSLFIRGWMLALSDRLRHVRVTCGDWKRIMGPSPTTALGVTAVLLDPPYALEGRAKVYNHESDVAGDVRAWCIEHGHDPKLRIALCGYAGEHDALEGLGWTTLAWKARGGYGNAAQGQGRENAAREMVWFSPHCLPAPEA